MFSLSLFFCIVIRMKVKTSRSLRKAPHVYGIHKTFTAIYVILAAAFLIAPIVLIRYELIFQSGLLGFFIGIAFLMLSATICSKELCRCHGEFYIIDAHVISIIFCCCCAAFCTAYYIDNVATILSMCPQFDVNSDVSLESQTELNITVSYMAPERGMLRRQSLNLKYNTEEKCLVRNHQNMPGEETLGSLNIESFRYEAARLRYLEKHREWLRTLNTEDEEETTKTDELQFYMLRNEIRMLIEETARPYEGANGFSTRSVVPLQTTSLQQDEQFELDRAAKICRNEKGLAVFLLGILIFCEILYAVTIGVYAWLGSWTTTLCPVRVQHLPTCNQSLPPPSSLNAKTRRV